MFIDIYICIYIYYSVCLKMWYTQKKISCLSWRCLLANGRLWCCKCTIMVPLVCWIMTALFWFGCLHIWYVCCFHWLFNACQSMFWSIRPASGNLLNRCHKRCTCFAPLCHSSNTSNVLVSWNLVGRWSIYSISWSDRSRRSLHGWCNL